jgi:NADPH:quinone reductase-like Zn-dependent oxidoreductase
VKAIVRTRYGSPDVLEMQDVAVPVPTERALLVKVHAASVNAADWHVLRGKPYFARATLGLRTPKHPTLGADVAGTVEAAGAATTRFRPGDEVFGDLSTSGFGTFAEYVLAPEDMLATKPANLTFEQAAAVPLAGVTALQGLRDSGHIQPGMRVLVNGAAGGVGSFAVQLARHFGTEVTGVCSTPKLELVRSIGAQHVIDYMREDFTRTGTTYDLIYDAVGNRSVADLRRALNPGGICAVAGFSSVPRLAAVGLLGPLVRRGNRRVRLTGTTRPNAGDLAVLKDIIEAGAVTPLIDRRYPLRDVSEAIRYVEAGHASGKVVITVALDA